MKVQHPLALVGRGHTQCIMVPFYNDRATSVLLQAIIVHPILYNAVGGIGQTQLFRIASVYFIEDSLV